MFASKLVEVKIFAVMMLNIVVLFVIMSLERILLAKKLRKIFNKI